MNTINNNINIAQPQQQAGQTKPDSSSGQKNNQQSDKLASVGYTPASEEKMRLAELKDSVKSGTYNINFEKAAASILVSGDI